MANGGLIGPNFTFTAASTQAEVIHTKTSDGTFTTGAATTVINAVIIAGGGGGGAGGARTINCISVCGSTPYSFQVGAGGSSNGNGTPSYLTIGCTTYTSTAGGSGGAGGTGGMIIWPLFGTTNQLLAGLSLLVVSVMLVKLGRPSRYTMIPMVFVTTMAFLSALLQLWDLYRSGNYLLLLIDVLIVIAAIFVMLEASSAFMREKRNLVNRSS